MSCVAEKIDKEAIAAQSKKFGDEGSRGISHKIQAAIKNWVDAIQCLLCPRKSTAGAHRNFNA